MPLAPAARTAASLAYAAVVACSAGCFSYTAAEADRALSAAPTPIAPDDWPARDPAAVGSFRQATPAELFRYEIDPTAAPDTIPEASRTLAATPWRRLTSSEIRAGGLLRVYETVDEPEDWGRELIAALTGFDPNADYLSSYRTGDPDFRFMLEDARSGAGSLAVPPHPGLRYVRNDVHMLDEGIELGLPTSVPPSSRGILLHLTALIGNSYETRVVEDLAARGWVPVHVGTLTGVIRPNEEAIADALRRRDARRQELWGAASPRVMSLGARTADPRLVAAWRDVDAQARAEIPTPPSGFEPASYDDADLRASARLIAEAVDQGMAENAYAAEAAIAWTRERHPALADAPVVVLGFSAGAIVAPAVAARLGDQVAAVILVGGGVDALRISQESPVSDGLIRLAPEGQTLPPGMLRRLRDLYLEESRLDPHHTAALLRGRPVLVAHAAFDKIVPAAAGEALIHRLGNPDRFIYLGGHKGLFYMLPGRADDVAAWLDRAVPAPPPKVR